MKILFMADVVRDPNAGAAGSEVQTAEALRRLGHDVDEVWAPQLGRRIAHGNLHYLLELPRAYRRELRRAFAAKQYDAVRVNQPHGYLAAEWLARHHPRAAFVHRSHGLELRAERDLAPWRARFEPPRPLPRRAASAVMAALLARHTHRVVRAADGHEVVCTEDRDFLVEELGVPPERIGVIPAAAPAELLATPAPPLTPERLRTVLHVSQFAFFKAPMIAAEAMNRIGAAHPDARFVWVCSAAHHDDIRALLAPAVRPRVELLGWMPQEALRAVYDRSGIFLFPSFYEGFGKVFLEAMSRGLAVVATDIAGPRDVIDDATTGFLVDAGDAAAIAARAERLLADPDEAARIGAAAAAAARAYTWERIARETAAFYQRLSDGMLKA